MKLKSYIGIFLTTNTKKREERKFNYTIFEDDWWKQESNALPSHLYFRPKDIVVLDLFAKKDIEKAKIGLRKLYKKYYSHKFIMGASFDDDIEHILKGLDQALTTGKSWYRTSLFDFENHKELHKYVEYFEIQFLNVSPSYAAIEIFFSLTKEFEKEIECFIESDYENRNNQISKIWKKNKKKSGAVAGIATGGSDSNESAKSRIIYEQLEYVKKLCMKEINGLFSLFSRKFKNIYGINVFETNIPCDDNLNMEIYNSIGMDLMDGFLLSKAEKLFVSTSTLYSVNKYESDMMYVYNPQLVDKNEAYPREHDYIKHRLRYFLVDMCIPVIYKNMGIYYYEQTIAYRNKIHRIEMNKRSYGKLLKLRYDFENQFYDFNIIKNQIPIDDVSCRLLQELEECDYVKYSCYRGIYPYKLFISIPQNMWHRIVENYTNLSNELERKIEIASNLKEYDNVKKGYRLSWYQFLVALITLYLVLYPEKVMVISEFITNIMKKIIGILQ